MKKHLLIFGLLLASLTSSFGQMTLLHTFASDFPNLYDIQIVNLSLSGKKIALVRHTGGNIADTIFYYNMDYSFWKMIPCPMLPGYSGVFNFTNTGSGAGITYSSETLFNTDSLLEAAVCYFPHPGVTPLIATIYIINENGVLTDSINNIAGSSENYIVVHRDVSGSCIATTTTNSGPQIYSLPGTIPCEICGGGLGLAKNDSEPANLLTAPVPNPSKDRVKINFTLPEGANKGELTIYNNQGKKMNSYTVDNRFGFIMVDDSQFAPGVYYYNLMVNGEVSSAQKMLVVK